MFSTEDGLQFPHNFVEDFCEKNPLEWEESNLKKVKDLDIDTEIQIF